MAIRSNFVDFVAGYHASGESAEDILSEAQAKFGSHVRPETVRRTIRLIEMGLHKDKEEAK